MATQGWPDNMLVSSKGQDVCWIPEGVWYTSLLFVFHLPRFDGDGVEHCFITSFCSKAGLI